MEQQPKKIKGITFNRKNGTKGIIPFKAIIYSLFAYASMETGMILSFSQSPAHLHIISHASWLMAATLFLGYMGAGSYISALALMTKYNPEKESGHVGGSIEQTTNPKGS